MEGHIRSSAIKGRHTSIQVSIGGVAFHMVADKLETSGAVMGMVMVKSLVAVLCWQQLCSSRGGCIAMI
jgi:hypothetical protein